MLDKMRWGDRTLDFGQRTLIMGIINCTPDSFYPGSRSATLEAALLSAADMTSTGVDIIDVGGESTRPGSEFISDQEEIDRVCPVIEGIRKASDVLISIDTRKAKVAEEALRLGADMVNDISSLRSGMKCWCRLIRVTSAKPTSSAACGTARIGHQRRSLLTPLRR